MEIGATFQASHQASMNPWNWTLWVVLLFLCSCGNTATSKSDASVPDKPDTPFLVVLGTVQDAGLPQLGCQKSCCAPYQESKDPDKNVVSLGLVDPVTNESYLFEATPDIARQLVILNQYISNTDFVLPDGIFLTHAHIGHYTGLMQLGREAYNANNVAVYAMPKMREFLEENGPWDLLVRLGNIALKPLQNETAMRLNAQLKVEPLLVPHRGEYSETVGFKITGPNKTALFIPDIDKWAHWDMAVETILREVDYAFLDATFFDGEEINNRDMSEIPHPFVIESMSRFDSLPEIEKKKVHFIHLNHTNPLLNPESGAYQEVLDKGYRIAETHQLFPL